MRLEINIPDSTQPAIKSKISLFLSQLSARPELIESVRLEENDTDEVAIQAMFTPERIAHIDEAIAEAKAGKFFTPAQVDDHFAHKEALWTQSHRS